MSQTILRIIFYFCKKDWLFFEISQLRFFSVRPETDTIIRQKKQPRLLKAGAEYKAVPKKGDWYPLYSPTNLKLKWALQVRAEEEALETGMIA